MKPILTPEEVRRIRETKDTDLAVDQYDAGDYRLIIDRATLERLCDSHEELRRFLAAFRVSLPT